MPGRVSLAQCDRSEVQVTAEATMVTNSTEPSGEDETGWFARVGDWVGSFSPFDGESDGPGSRWTGVLAAGWQIVSQVRALGMAAWNGDEPDEVGDLLEDLQVSTEQLVASVPPAVEVVDDLEALEAKLHGAVEDGDPRDVLAVYLSWLEDLVERVVGHVVRRAFSDGRAHHALLDADQLKQLFSACESVIDEVVRRWVVDETLGDVDPRGRG